MREYDLKKALSTGSYTRNSIKPQLLVAEDGEYRQGDILDANATMEVVNSTASDIDDKINDILGVDNGAVQELVGILSDSDTTTGILNELAKKANISDLETVAGDIPQVPTNVSAFTNDAGYLTQHQDISGKANSSDLSTVATSGSYNDLSNKPNLANVATSGSYEDLSNKPHIPEDPVQSDWTEDDTTDQAYIKNKPNLATVATTGDYTDLSNKPTIPAALIQSDWAQDDNTQVDYIKNKPNIPNIDDLLIKPTAQLSAEGHDYVEIGGIKWATMNVGASTVTDTGLYFLWADTQGYTANQIGTDKQFSASDCKYGPVDENDGPDYGMTKYNDTDGLTTIQSSDDAVKVAWGGNWRMPTGDEFEALGAAVNTEWVSNYLSSGISGMLLTDKTNSNRKLFFPASGCGTGGSIYSAGTDGLYWSSTLYGAECYVAHGPHFNLAGIDDWIAPRSRYIGCNIRGVYDGTVQSTQAAIVATSGDYNDLKNKPTIPAEQIQSDWNQSDTTAKDYIKNKPTIPTIEGIVNANGHEYIEIGGVKWAITNVGASNVTDYGLYFQWGDIQGYNASQVGTDKIFNWESYKYTTNGEWTGINKYNNTDGKTTLDIADDAVRANWGGSWRMPTTAEFEALGEAVNITWVTDYQGSGVNGILCTDKIDTSKILFFPAGGYGGINSVTDVGVSGGYWSSLRYGNSVDMASQLDVHASPNWNEYDDRCVGLLVRGVLAEVDTLSNATQSQSGLMSSADKTKLDELSTVATTGSYNDLTDKPTIPTKVSDLTNNSDFLKNPHISNGHEYVEIAGMKWATMNIGATSTTDKGLFFAWGETVGYPYNTNSDAKSFSLSDYKYAEFDGSDYIYTKYNDTDQKTQLDLEDDPASVNWGGNWRMPIAAEFLALKNACIVKLVHDNGVVSTEMQPSGVHVVGFLFIDKTDSTKTVYFPYCLFERDGHGPISQDDGSNMFTIWLNNVSTETHKASNTVGTLTYTNGNWDGLIGAGSRADFVYAGRAVRPILDEQSTPSTVAEVAITGDYNDLINKPTIPLASWTQDDYTQADFIKNKPDYSKALLKPVLDIATTNSNGHDYIEFGGVKWATMNVGAQAVTDYGKFFQWGDTEGYTADQCGNQQGKKKFDWSDYKYRDGVTGATTGTQGFTKYTNADGLTQLEIEDDAVRSNWGGNWRMPTAAEFQALDDATDGSWTNDYEGTGVSGLILTDKVDQTKKIFFPAAGDCWYGTRNAVGTSGMYWSNSLKTSYVPYSYNLHFDNHGLEEYDNEHFRYNGFPVRGVLDGTVQPNQASVVAITGDYNDLVNKPIIRSESLTLNLSDQTSTITGANNSGRVEIVIYDNTSQNDYTVSISTSYKTVDGNQIVLSVPAGCYGEVCYTNIGGTIFAKGIKQLANS